MHRSASKDITTFTAIPVRLPGIGIGKCRVISCLEGPKPSCLCYLTERDGSDQEDESDGSGDEAEEGRKGGKMSIGHKTGLQKVPNVIEWLSHALSPAKVGRQETTLLRS